MAESVKQGRKCWPGNKATEQKKKLLSKLVSFFEWCLNTRKRARVGAAQPSDNAGYTQRAIHIWGANSRCRLVNFCFGDLYVQSCTLSEAVNPHPPKKQKKKTSCNAIMSSKYAHTMKLLLTFVLIGFTCRRSQKWFWCSTEDSDLWCSRVHGQLKPLKRNRKKEQWPLRWKQAVAMTTITLLWSSWKCHYFKRVRLNYLLNIDFDAPVVILVQSFEGTLD